MDLFYLATLWILLSLLIVRDVNGAVDRAWIQYSRDALLQLNFVNGADVSDATIQLPECIRKRSRRRGGNGANAGVSDCASGQGRQFVFRSGGDNNHNLECGLKSAGYPYVSYSSIQRCITICSTVYCQVLKLFEYSNTGSEN